MVNLDVGPSGVARGKTAYANRTLSDGVNLPVGPVKRGLQKNAPLKRIGVADR